MGHLFADADAEYRSQSEGKLKFQHHDHAYAYEAYRPGLANPHDEATCRGCQYCGACNIVYRECDDQFLAKRPPQGDESDTDGRAASMQLFSLLPDDLMHSSGI